MAVLTGRVVARLDPLLAYVGPGLAAVLGLVALGHRPVDVDEAAAVAAVDGPFSDVVERALSEDPARAGYLALLQPVAAWNDGEHWVRLPSVAAAVVAAIACYRLGRRLAGRRAGAAASIALASSLGVVSISRSVGPLALALAATLVSSALFARAVERGNVVWWAVYAVSASFLPLTHPIAAGALAAHLAAAVVGRREIDLRLAAPAVAVGVLESAIFLVAAIVDRADAPDAVGPLELADVGTGAGRAVGWSPVLAGLALYGAVALQRRTGPGAARWRETLAVCLVVMPLVAVLAAGIALPVFPRAALTVAAGGVAVLAGIGAASIGDRLLRLAALVSLAAVAVAALVAAAAGADTEDWRAAARFARATAPPRGSVVVLPERARAAFAYYAPEIRTSLVGRGDAVTVIVVGDRAQAITAARRVVSPPRYALLEERNAGSRLVVQRWVRP